MVRRDFMRLFPIALLFSFFVLSTPAFSGPGTDHTHELLTKREVSIEAETYLESLISRGKIDPSWEYKAPFSVEKKVFSKGPERVVAFRNGKLPDPNQRVLYMFFTLDGHYLAANYSGE